MNRPTDLSDFLFATGLTATALVALAVALVAVLSGIGHLADKLRQVTALDVNEDMRRHVAGEYPAEGWKP